MRPTDDPELLLLRKRIEELERQLALQPGAHQHNAAGNGEGLDLALVPELSGIFGASVTSGEILDRIIDIAPRFVSADGYAAWRKSGGDGAWVLSACSGLSSRFIEELGTDSLGEVELTPEPMVFEDIDRAPLIARRRSCLRSEGIRSMLAMPIYIDVESWGTLDFYWRTQHTITPAEKQAAIAIGSIATIALTAAEIVDRRTAELERVTDRIPALISYIDAQHRFCRINQAYEDFFGLKRDQILDRTIAEIAGSEHYETARPYLERALRGKQLKFRSHLRHQDGRLRDVELSCTPEFAMDGTVSGIVVMTLDITGRAHEEQASSRLAEIVDSSDDAIVSKTLNGVITSWNRAAESMFGYTAAEAVGQHITLIIPEDRLGEEDEVLARVRRGDKVDHFQTVRRTKNGQLIEISLTVSPVRDSNGKIVGASKIARELTERRRSEELRAQLAAIVDSSDDVIVSKSLDGVITSWNRAAERIFGYTAAEAVGQHITLIIPDDKRAEEEEVLARIRSGERVDHFETERQTKDGRRVDISLTVSPVLDGNGTIFGFSKIARDITDKKRGEERLIENERYLQAVLDSMPECLKVLGPDGTILQMNRAGLRMIEAESLGQVLGSSVYQIVDERDREALRSATEDIFRGGSGGTLEFNVTGFKGTKRTLEANIVPLLNAQDRPVGALSVTRDITQWKRVETEQLALLAREKKARATAEQLNRVGPILVAELEPDNLTRKVVEIATQAVHAEFGALFYKSVDESGQPSVSRALSGTTQGVLERLLSSPNTDLLDRTFRGQGPIRSDDVLRDRRYGSDLTDDAMQEGNAAISSYLAVPVVSRSGKVLGGLFFGHSQPAIFTEEAEHIAAGIAAQAAMALDNASLFAESQRSQEALRVSNEELKRVNEDLHQFAHSASHDLQEPLRTISVYSQLLRRRLEIELSDEHKEYISYILKGTGRMEALIKDLLVYNQASSFTGEPAPLVDANTALEAALLNLTAAIEASGANVVREALPQVRIREIHLTQLFQNLVGNAIKYRGEQIPRIRVSAQPGENEWLFSVEDNGIGIDKKYREQIFGIFKRLHTADEYSGTGMGLAISRRIVERAGGRIWVESQPRGGSTFFFTLPFIH
jgi:PAS domain S-box-containing protein